MSVTYDNKQILVHIPVDLYHRLKTTQTERLLSALYNKRVGVQTKAKKVSLHDIVVETLAEAFPEK